MRVFQQPPSWNSGVSSNLTLTGSPAQMLAAGFNSTNVSPDSFQNATFCSYFSLNPPVEGSPTLTPQIASELELIHSGGAFSGSATDIADMVSANLQSASQSSIVSSGQLSLNLNRFLQNGQALQVVYRQVF